MSFYDYEDPYSSVKKTDKTIILDLDETLICTFEPKEVKKMKRLNILTDPTLMHLRSRLYVVNIKDIDRKGGNDSTIEYGFTRPYLDDFLKFCNRYFKYVIVWSAGCYDYVHEICKYLFVEIPPPVIIYTRDDCEKDHKLKPLTKLITNEKLPGLSLDKIFVIDDKTYTFENNKQNAILMPPYRINPTIESISNEDDTLLKLIDWFLRPEVVNAKDTTKLSKADIFK